MADILTDLEQDLNWREAELSILKIKAVTAAKDYKIVLLRALTALLYAHLEGFFRFSWERLLIEYERSMEVRGSFLPEIISFSLATEFSNVKCSYSNDDILTFFLQDFNTLMTQNIVFSKRLVDSQNLSPEKIEKDCKKIGITLSELNNYSVFIKSLISRRNDIAHGKDNQIKTIEEYLQYEKAAYVVMYDLFYAIQELTTNRTFLTIP